jgi:hypothetical protein
MAKHYPNENQQYWTRLDDQSVNQNFLRSQAVTDDVVELTIVRWDSTQLKWTPAAATPFTSSLTNQNTLGVAIQVDLINHISDVVLKGGICPGFTGLTPGSDYWLSSTAGAITSTRPGTGPALKIGRAITATQMFLDISFFRFNNQLLTTIDWTQKDAHVADWTLISGTGTVLYDNTIDGRFGTGVYKFTGTGSWVLNAFFPMSTFLGIGGYAHYATAAGAGSITFGVEQYNFTLGFLSNMDFILSGGATSTTWAFAEALKLTGIDASCRWVRPRMQIVTNPGTTYVDGWLMFTPGYARTSKEANHALVADFATTANYS